MNLIGNEPLFISSNAAPQVNDSDSALSAAASPIVDLVDSSLSPESAVAHNIPGKLNIKHFAVVIVLLEDQISDSLFYHLLESESLYHCPDRKNDDPQSLVCT